MMTSSEIEVENLSEKNTEDTAILEVSTMAVGGVIKQESRDVDFLSNCSTSVEGSVIASPSIDSFSTLPEQEISDFQTDSRDLQVKVDNPQKHLETLETYITFRITTKSTRPEFEEGEYVVRRRYNDFIWLRRKLVDSYPTRIIPPMPGKHTLLAQLDRYSKEFIIARMKLLHVFLNRVVNHPILSCDKNLFIFLATKPAEFLIYRKNRGNVLVKMTDSLQNIASTYTMKRHFEFEQIRDYCTALSEKLAIVDKINHRIHKERQELAPFLLAIAKAIECNAMAHQKLLENVPNEEREYISYVDAVKNALSRRDSMQIEYEMTVEVMAKKRLEKDQLMGLASGITSTQNWGGSLWKAESRNEKLERLGQAIPRLAKQAELLQDRVECANENLRSDLQRWNVEKQVDLKNMLISMADRQIRHYQQCMNAWEEILTGLKLNGIGSEVSVGPPIKIPV
ncbi:Sorting nexin-30 [Eufriesea mexicana]|uniref:Sorting nexin-30 n=1 Tax=Eufriesea mexicana TaxID=516756 RepID=A0A310SPR6_9HYME|nr:Sorting nexin-30 [Eufriesea mexicana]